MTNRLVVDRGSENQEVLTDVLNKTLGVINTRDVVKNGHDALLAQLISYRMFTTFQPERLKNVEALIRRKVELLARETDQVGTVQSGKLVFATLEEKFKDYEVPCPIILELYSKCLQHPVTILTSEHNGYGKTTLATMLRAFAELMGNFRTLWMSAKFKLPPKGPGKPWLVIVDNFLNQYSPDFCHMGKCEEIESLNDIAMSQDSGNRFIFITRQSVLDAALDATGACMRCIIARGNVMTLTSIHRDAVCEKLLSRIHKELKEIKPSNLKPDALLYCCKLFAQKRRIFSNPRNIFKAGMKKVMEGNEAAKSVLFLLAVHDDAVDKTSSDNRKILKCLKTNVELDSAIPEFCRQYRHLVVMEGDFVMFASEVLRDATLVVLWESDCRGLAEHCSGQTLLRLTTLCSKSEVEARSGDDESKVDWEDEISSNIENKITKSKYRDVLQPSLFKSEAYKEIAKEWCDGISNNDAEGCHILFWTGFDLEFFENTKNSLDQPKPGLGLVTLCYWGRTQKLEEMLMTCKVKLDDYIEEILRLDRSRSIVPFDPGETLLTLAAWRGHHEVVKMLLQKGCSVNTQDKGKKQTALMHYCARRDKRLDLLLNHGADPSLGDKWRMTALHYAVSGREWEFPNELLTAETVSARNCRQETPLLLACMNAWSLGAIKRLEEAGAADPQAEPSAGHDYLHAARCSGSDELFSYLLRKIRLNPGRDQDLLELAKCFPSRNLIPNSLSGDDGPMKEE